MLKYTLYTWNRQKRKFTSRNILAKTPLHAVKTYFKGKTENELPKPLLGGWHIVVKNNKGTITRYQVVAETKVIEYFSFHDVTENIKKLQESA